ncbi:MAG TPA: helix-turn-helix domain-containing protein [Caulobacteraceae bacterium]|nr:helix-turn-helix domain-containing protein [Caulobacteraceae bacterium]
MPRTGYGQFCPVAKAAEVFAQKWTPLIARELCFGPKRFSDLQTAMPLISRALLAKRLVELQAAGVVVREVGGQRRYAFTEAGEALRPIIEHMSAWGQRWGQGRIAEDELDPGMLVWGLLRQIDPAGIPSDGLTVRFEFRGLPREHAALRYWWLVLKPGSSDVCRVDPGHAVDVVVGAELRAFVEVWLGHEGLAAAAERKAVSFHGPPDAVDLAVRLMRLGDEPHAKAFVFRDQAA